MSGLSLITQNVNITVDDNFHRTYSMTPYHHPEINNQCNSTNACTLNITTMSELNYETMDYMDMGYSNTAQEIKAKYISRQQLYIAAGYPNTTFDIDTNATCYDINKMVYDWALKKVPEDVKERYIKYGIPYEFGEDLGNYNGGMWIIEYITYELNAKKTAVIVRSPYMSTSMNMIKLFAGFHYCKVLSPARAIEWIYLDSLRQNLGLNTK